MHVPRNMLAITVVVTLAALIPSGRPLAGVGTSDHDITIVRDGEVRVVTTDQDGNHHEEVYKLSGGSGAYLGVQLDLKSGDRGGARIEQVIEDTPAASAGLRDGDVIVRIDGHEIDNGADLTHRMHDLEPGDRVEVEIRRDGRTQTLSVQLGERKGHSMALDLEGLEQFGERMGELGERLGRGFAFDFDGHEGFDSEAFQEHMRELGEKLGDMKLDIPLPDLDGLRHVSLGGKRPMLGVQLVATTAELRQHLGGTEDAGVLVGKVLPGRPAEAADVRVGDLIVAVDGEPVKTSGDLIDALSDRSGETVELELIRDGRALRLDVTLDEVEPVGDRASSNGYLYRWNGMQDMEATRRAYADAMNAARAAAADSRNVVNDAMRHYRRALSATRDLSETY